LARASQYLRVQSLPSLAVSGLGSIRHRILALAIVGTLVPAAITLGIAYTQNRRALEARISADLLSESNQTAGAIGVWLKERLYDLRVFAASDEVSSNLNRFASGQGSIPSARLRDYLRSLHERFPDFEQIMVLDGQGRTLATSAQQSRSAVLPDDWQRVMRQENQVVGNAFWDDRVGRGKLILAVPVHRADGRLLGAFAAELNLAPLQLLLRTYGRDSTMGGRVYLAHHSGALIASSQEISKSLLGMTLPAPLLGQLNQHGHAALQYASVTGDQVLGTLEPVAQTRWSVISEVGADNAFAQVRQFRNVAMLIVILVLAVVSLTAYRLGLLIVRPLERLAEGAAEVAMGDLEVDLPDNARGEVGVLTGVFNHMVARLREGRQALADTNEALRSKNTELERLSVTDGLTGLTNHRALMQRLNEEAVRSRRTDRSFSVIMADVDHFKTYNDTFGHPAGDDVLKKVALLLKEATRTVDCVGRYGGEEFAVLLPETAMDGAMEVAERIRHRVETAQFPGRQITMSIGVAEFPKDASEVSQIVVVADEALYVAKREGRNQVVQAKRQRKQKLPASESAPAARAKKTAKKKN
jgi:diguanylate cyclase (GGDEF)-like protein